MSADDRSKPTEHGQGTIPPNELAELLTSMEGPGGWRAAIQRSELPTVSRKRFWFTDDRKASFYRSLTPTENAVAVDVGAGSGVISAALSGQYERVVAFERHPQWCEFMAKRFQQDGLHNVTAVCGDALKVPLKPSTVDLVVINGVLEWIPESDLSQRPDRVQCTFLEDVRDTLRPGGVVAIAIENRFYLGNFLGVSPHGEPPFVAVMPRFAADWVTQRDSRKSYRTWIYGVLGHRRMLKRAGFRDIRVLQALPNYHQPEEVARITDGSTTLKYFTSQRTSRRAIYQTLSRLGLLGLLCHSFYVTASR